MMARDQLVLLLRQFAAMSGDAENRALLLWGADIIASNICTCYPGEPRGAPQTRVEDIVCLDDSDGDYAHHVRRAAQAALDAGVEPGIRRARWIDGYLAALSDARLGSSEASE